MKQLLLVLLCVLVACDAYKVLVVYPFPAKSLNNLGEGIVRHLINAGHEVTYITCYPRKISNGKLREIDVSDNAEILEDDDHMKLSFILDHGAEVSQDVSYLQDLCLDSAKQALQNKNVKVLLDNPNEHFDVVIADYLETEVYAGFAALYNCPMIWSYSMGAHWLAMRLVDDASNPAYSSDYISSYAPPFSFIERWQVLWRHVQWRYAKYFKLQPKEEEAYNKIFGPAIVKRGRPLPAFDDLIYNASLVLSNEHLASGAIPKTPQNWKLVGGYHIEMPPKPLLKDLQDIMDNAKHGVIYFSMGSVWRSEFVPKNLTEGLLKVFGELKATVIWKYEATLNNLPKNVHIVKWAPQQSILAHPNCKLFISHGGLLSSTEAIHFAVPTIGVPISYDQFINLGKAVKRGYAIMVDLSYNLPQDLKRAIQIMFDDPKYKQKAMELSAIYHDRPISPGTELVHWVEYVIRTKGAGHLRSPAFDTPFYQKAYLDVIAILCAPVVLVLALKRSSGKSKGKKQKRS